jgi:Spx/MgsR family transcriptional regulator
MNVYGIKSCDSCRKVRRWLDEQGRSYQWCDLRDDGLDAATVQFWLDATGPDVLVNRRSTTWRGLSEMEQATVMDAETSAAVLVAHPTLVKRPVFVAGDRVLVGFGAAVREAL